MFKGYIYNFGLIFLSKIYGNILGLGIHIFSDRLWIIYKDYFILFRVCRGGVFLGVCAGCWGLFVVFRLIIIYLSAWP